MDNNNKAQLPALLQSQVVSVRATPKIQKLEAREALRLLGADDYDLILPETRYVTQLLTNDEVLLGAVYGKYNKTTLPFRGRGLMVITNYRILLVDKKPLFLQFDDVKFDTISGIQYTRALAVINVTLTTRMGNFTMRTFNDNCARHFVQAVEDMLFNRKH